MNVADGGYYNNGNWENGGDKYNNRLSNPGVIMVAVLSLITGIFISEIFNETRSSSEPTELNVEVDYVHVDLSVILEDPIKKWVISHSNDAEIYLKTSYHEYGKDNSVEYSSYMFLMDDNALMTLTARYQDDGTVLYNLGELGYDIID